MISASAVELSLLLFVALATALWLTSLVWLYRDAERRGKSGWLVTILVALVAWPAGLLVWLVARPERVQP